MSDKTQESGQSEEEVLELPEPKFSQPADDQPTSEKAESSVGNSVDELRELIKEEVSRAVQSTKDRRLDEAERTYGELSDLRETLKRAQEGENVDALMTSVQQRQAEQKIQQLENTLQSVMSKLEESSRQPQQPQSQPNFGGNQRAEEAQKEAYDIIRKAGLDKDKDTVTWLNDTEFGSADELLSSVKDRVLTKVLDGGSTSGSGVTQDGSGTSGSGNLDLDALNAEYEKLRMQDFNEVLPGGKTVHERKTEVIRLIEEASAQ